MPRADEDRPAPLTTPGPGLRHPEGDRHHEAMADRQELIRRAFAAYADGDLEPFRALIAQDAQWIGVPQGRSPEETPACRDRSQIVALLERHHEHGRRFLLGEMIERDDRVAVEITVVSPEWSAPAQVFKVFTFGQDGDVVVRLNDCIDESYALQVLAA